MTKKILLVDDEPDLRAIFSELLVMEGFDVVEAHNGEQALLVIQSERPDIIISDIKMPRMDGIALHKFLQETPITASIPFVLITGNPPINQPPMVFAMLQKPVQFHRLLAVLNCALNQSNR
jgi:CheY-like chemotaxis protein